MTDRVIGYVLLVSGILIILASALSVITVFTGRAEPIQIFQFGSIGLNASDLIGGDLPQEQVAIAKQMTEGQKMELISADLINDTSNVLAHLFLMGFISTVGFKIASLGTMMVRPIVVKLKEANAPQQVQRQV